MFNAFAIIIGVTIVLVVLCCIYFNNIKVTLISIGTGVLIIILALMLYFNISESGKRDIKSIKSDLGGGITRVVTVYDVEGDVIAEYKGKFDVEYNDNRILFDDENGLRHIIYYSTGNIIIDEIKD